MPKITFYQLGNEINSLAEYDENLLDAARRAGLIIESPCNGNGTCGKCQVKIRAESGEERKVLACNTTVDQDIYVEIIDCQDGNNLQIKQDGQAHSLDVDSAITKIYFSAHDCTEVYHHGELIAVEAGNTAVETYGVVVDIGTTTLVVSLVDLITGKELDVTGALNPQSRLAQDVLSRIKYASNEAGLEEMHRLFRGELNRMIEDLVAGSSIDANRIYEVVFSGNTCMLHLAAKVNPAALGRYPYTPVIRGGNYLLAADLGIKAAVCARVYLPPIISAYVGADITAGILASRLESRQGVCLFIDIGTNGEMVLADNGKLAAASTAAGPAFEGMNISQGMRAVPGAIEAFKFESDGLRVVSTIGGKKAVGICGSGLLDLVAQLVSHGFVGKNGKFKQVAEDGKNSYLTINQGKIVFEVVEEVYLTQKDIRQVQLAKGAIRAGIEALLEHRGLSAAEVDKVLIAGSFGYHLNPESLIGIGLLPAEFRGKIEFLGNTSKTGGHAFLVNKEYRRQICDIVENVAVLELANIGNFDKLFVKCLEF